MNDVRIAIVDDLAAERMLLRSRLERQMQGRSVQAVFCEYDSGEAFLAAEREQRFTAVFLDIYMTGMSGMDTARELRKLDTDCILVFTTTSTDHALEGFQVRAMHYLVKPYTEEELGALTEEILSRVPRPEKYLELKVSGSMVCLGYRDIVFAEHFSHMIHIRTIAGTMLATRLPFKTFIAPLKEDPRFLVCGRGVIVNLEHAERFEDSSFRMKDGTLVYVNRELWKSARQTFMEYLLQRGRVS